MASELSRRRNYRLRHVDLPAASKQGGPQPAARLLISGNSTYRLDVPCDL